MPVVARVGGNGRGRVDALEPVQRSDDKIRQPATQYVTDDNWEDTWFFALGATWRPNEMWTLRGGVALDQDLIPNSRRALLRHARRAADSGVTKPNGLRQTGAVQVPALRQSSSRLRLHPRIHEGRIDRFAGEPPREPDPRHLRGTCRRQVDILAAGALSVLARVIREPRGSRLARPRCFVGASQD